MTTLIIGTNRSDRFADGIRAHDPAFKFRVWPDVGRADEIRYALAWGPPPGELAKLPNLELIVSVGAGVDHLFNDPLLPNVPVVRFVDDDLTSRMVSYVAANVLYHHRRMSELADQQRDLVWEYLPEPAAHELSVGIMGLGVLGQACAKALAPLGYKLNGWTRTQRDGAGIQCFVGRENLSAFLAATDIVVVLLPLTPDTRGIITAEILSQLRKPKVLPGPVLINAGRGGLQNEDDIISCLNSGILYAASLDVFSTEPLPIESPVWVHPRIRLTPHIAAESDPRAIAHYLIAQTQRHKRGDPLINVVDRSQGY
jgi:glyoxylate/hydroxypyruvate reductase